MGLTCPNLTWVMPRVNYLGFLRYLTTHRRQSNTSHLIGSFRAIVAHAAGTGTRPVLRLHVPTGLTCPGFGTNLGGSLRARRLDSAPQSEVTRLSPQCEKERTRDRPKKVAHESSPPKPHCPLCAKTMQYNKQDQKQRNNFTI